MHTHILKNKAENQWRKNTSLEVRKSRANYIQWEKKSENDKDTRNN